MRMSMPKRKSVLYLPIAEPWFSMIRDGIKTEEYREDKPYYQARFICQNEEQLKDSYDLIYGGNIVSIGHSEFAIQKMRKYDYVEFRNGYGKNAPRIRFKNPRVRYNYGKPEWGAEPYTLYFVLTWDSPYVK